MDVESSAKAFEEDVLVSGFGIAPVKAEGAGVQYDSAREVWTARYTHETIALAFSITHEAMKDNLYGNIGAKYSKELARSLQHTKEVKAANILNRAFSSSYTGGDGKELCATDHPLSGGGTFANELATPADLSETALEDAIIGIRGFVDERGKPVDVMPSKLLIPYQMEFEAHRILYSNLRSGTADNDTNAIKDLGMFPGGVHVIRLCTNVASFNIFIRLDREDSALIVKDVSNDVGCSGGSRPAFAELLLTVSIRVMNTSKHAKNCSWSADELNVGAAICACSAYTTHWIAISNG